MAKVAIYGRESLQKQTMFLEMLYPLLEKLDIQYTSHSSIQKIFPNVLNSKFFSTHEELVTEQVDALISLGGDGTILDTLTLVRNSGIPVLGINLGRLGFLASVAKEDLEKALVSIQRGTYSIDKRTVLEVNSNFSTFGNTPYALNELTVQRSNSSSMIDVKTYINGELLNEYFTDGLIISTPTGSTGYSMSCGGPIIHPNSPSFIITPIAPHNLNVRPIVLSDDVVITLEVRGRTVDFLCTLDSRAYAITKHHQIAIRKAPFYLNLLRLNDGSFIQALKDKLLWGVDQRF